MKLWQKHYSVQQEIERFTIGDDQVLDLQLARFDILGSLAHIRMLRKVGLLSDADHEVLATGLKALHEEVETGRFVIEDGVEDVHSQVELLLTRAVGEAGKKIHSGRSRNDQVLVDLRLFFRAEMEALAGLTKQFFELLQELAATHRDVLLPGYTHYQVAMPSSFGLWFGAYAESLVDDLQQLLATFRINNQNPLGSAAGYGSSFPLDRRMTTELLGFDDLAYNVVHAQMGRGKTELFLSFALSALGSTLGKLAMDTVLYLCQNFGFLRFPDELTTGSSIMPHKKNPDVFELIRARCNQLQALPQQVSMLTTNLPSGYHRDYQLLKEALFPALQKAKQCLAIFDFAFRQLEVNRDILSQDIYEYLFSVEVVNRKVLEGVPFRDAYRQIGAQIEAGQFHPDRTVRHTHEGSIGNLCLEEVNQKMERVYAGFDFARIHARLEALLQ